MPGARGPSPPLGAGAHGRPAARSRGGSAGVLRKPPSCSPDSGRALAPPPLPGVDGAHGAWAQTPSRLLGHLAAPRGAPLAARAVGWGVGGGGTGWRPLHSRRQQHQAWGGGWDPARSSYLAKTFLAMRARAVSACRLRSVRPDRRRRPFPPGLDEPRSTPVAASTSLMSSGSCQAANTRQEGEGGEEWRGEESSGGDERGGEETRGAREGGGGKVRGRAE